MLDDMGNISGLKILFYTGYKVSSTKGGTERTTISIASGLTRYFGCRCYSLYSFEADTPKEDCFVEEFLWNRQHCNAELSNLIRKYQIDWIINQGSFWDFAAFKEACKGTGCRIVFAHHFAPGEEEKLLQWDVCVENCRKSSTWLSRLQCSVKVVFFPFFRMKFRHNLRSIYRNVYFNANRFVLLCSGAIPQFMKYANLNNADRFQIIPNALSYNDFLPLEQLGTKKPIVLIVSRLDDTHKRLSLALKIWGEVKKRAEAYDWQLNIVGHGHDEKMYRSMISQFNIPDVHLLGRQDPKSYYEESSIFLMTSRSEGWGLTLTEAQQFGCVPIAFNSFASLKDIITDGEDGVLVPECDVDKYVDKLAQLMTEKDWRKYLAKNAIKNCRRFSQEQIANEWYSVLTSKE